MSSDPAAILATLTLVAFFILAGRDLYESFKEWLKE